MKPIKDVVTDPEFEDEVARQILKSRSPRWLNIVTVLMVLVGLAGLALAFWVDGHTAQWVDFLDDSGALDYVQPLGIVFVSILSAVVGLTFLRRGLETETTLNWWVRIFRWRISSRIRKMVTTVAFSLLCMYQKIKAGTVVVCIVAVAVFGVFIYVTNRCDPLAYLTVEMADNGLPVRGTWGISEATAVTLRTDNRIRAEGPFRKGDGDAARRAVINNAWDAEGLDQTHYPYPIGPLAATPKARATLEAKTMAAGGGSPAPRVVQQIVTGGDNWNFVQLPRWDLTNAATMASEDFTRARPELGGMSIAQKINEAKISGGLYTSDATAAIFSVSEMEVNEIPEPPAAKASDRKLPGR